MLLTNKQCLIMQAATKPLNTKAMKSYEVELTTTQTISNGEDFWMYRGYLSKSRALFVAKLLSQFIPYFKYPTKVIVKEYDVFRGDKNELLLSNAQIIKRYSLKNEEGKVVKHSKN